MAACRLPFWPYVKLLFCMWLVLPIFNGAAYIYENVVRKYIKIGGYVSSNYADGQKRVLQMMSLDARKSVERFIERYGPNAFDRVVKAVRESYSSLATHSPHIVHVHKRVYVNCKYTNICTHVRRCMHDWYPANCDR